MAQYARDKEKIEWQKSNDVLYRRNTVRTSNRFVKWYIKKKLEQNAFDINKAYNSLMDPKDKGHLSERALGKEIQSMLNIELSPGELREIFLLLIMDCVMLISLEM